MAIENKNLDTTEKERFLYVRSKALTNQRKGQPGEEHLIYLVQFYRFF